MDPCCVEAKRGRMLLLYLDESGDHSPFCGDGQYPVFVLGGVVVAGIEDDRALSEELSMLKVGLFGDDEVVLHAADITRNRGRFATMKDPAFRGAFYERLNRFMESGRFQVIACAIRKDEGGPSPIHGSADLYLRALGILVGLFREEVRRSGSVQSGRIVAERRGSHLDRQLEYAWRSLNSDGMGCIGVADPCVELELRSKAENLAGLQLADLVVGPIARYVIGKPVRKDFEVIQGKFMKNEHGQFLGHGLVVL